MNPRNTEDVPATQGSDSLALHPGLDPFIREYLLEINCKTSVAAYLKELAVSPIILDGILMGFWGLQLRSGGGGRKLATMKALYLRKEYRGRYLDRAADDLIRRLSEQGVTELEIWSFQHVQEWLEKRYGIKPNIFVTYNPIDTFKVYKDEDADDSLRNKK